MAIPASLAARAARQPAAGDDELHITSLVVHSTPRRAERVAAFVTTLPAAEVHAISPTGKLIVTLEAATGGEILDQIAAIQRTEGVLSATVVYQCADSLSAMNEEMPDAPGPT
ncbi:MAG TPA: chaperone NapD [Rhizobacter sp.]|nr:chaperone NapD [Rhizobacter sp.]